VFRSSVAHIAPYPKGDTMTPDPEETYPYVVRKDARNYWQFETASPPVVLGR